jgi:Mannosyl-glycoprotein endo-beta-N-acetylglucosaminidase
VKPVRVTRGLLLAGVLTTAGLTISTAAYAAAPGAVVRTAGGALSVRTGPGTSFDRVGTLAPGTPLTIACQAAGQRIRGRVSISSGWDLLAGGGYVSHAYVAGAPALPACATAAPQDQAGYLAAIAPLARTWARFSGIPASVTIAQAILESGWGRSDLGRLGNNEFGIKCFGGPGPVAVGCRTYGTSECGSGGCAGTAAAFRVYANLADSFRDHDRFLRANSRYAAALAVRADPNAFATQLQLAGYATDPTYAAKLLGLMGEFNLYQFDH